MEFPSVGLTDWGRGVQRKVGSGGETGLIWIISLRSF